jgi:hypothetical protein
MAKTEELRMDEFHEPPPSYKIRWWLNRKGDKPLEILDGRTLFEVEMADARRNAACDPKETPDAT